ncbi:nucleoside hydrolase [Metabacillus iocasae]|uniref:Purine nucleosidase n=1 Tax=Priestia iocasae TaxID=2291674 RepID=A0ABS2QW14_9BACI|nr:nucleoside hydrolase [Metabacillus iocasae]MBM7703665.1 purine nucleosidase [Metabacillus iocasae]
MKKKKVLLFGDFGIDDSIALFYIWFRKEIEVVGIVADYGNVSREKVLRNINYLKYISGQYDIPVFAGAVIPLTGIEPEYFPNVHGPEGLGPIIPKIPSDMELPIHYTEDLITIIKPSIQDITIVTLGRLSSLASIFIWQLDEMDLFKEIIVMGGAFFYPGNVTPLAEANFYGDPYAANIIIRYAKKLTIIPLNVTQSALVTPEMVQQIDEFHQKTKDPVGLMIKPMLNYYYTFYSSNYPGILGSPMHDLLTIDYLIRPQDFKTSHLPINIVVSRGTAFGQSFADYRPKPAEGYNVHNVVLEFDYDLFKRTFLETFLQERDK